MNKALGKKTIIALFAFVLSMFSGVKVFATSNPFELVDLSVTSRSADVEGDASLNAAGEIENNIVFHHVNDWVEYLLELKNTSSEKMTITGVSDNNANPYIVYTYDDHANEEIAAGESLMLRVVAVYANEVTDMSARAQSSAIKISIAYKTEEIVAGSTDVEILTPDTGRNMFEQVFSSSNSAVIVVLASFGIIAVGAYSIKRKNKIAVVVYALLFVFMFAPNSTAEPGKVNEVNSDAAINFGGSFALYDKLLVNYDIDESAKSQVIAWGATVGDLQAPTRDGYNFTYWFDANSNYVDGSTPLTGDLKLFPGWLLKVANLSVGCRYCGGDYPINVGLQNGPKLYYTSLKNHFGLDYNNVANLFTRAATKPSDEIIASAWNVASSTSAYPVYLWYDETAKTLYWWSEAGQVKLPYYSKYAFYQFPVKKFDMTGISAVDSRELEGLFMYSKATEIVLGSNFNSGNVWNMGSMFYGLSGLTSVDLENLDTSNNQYFSFMFNDTGLASVDFSDADFSNVYSLESMFSNTPNLTSVKLPSMDVSYADMREMFDGASAIETIDLSMMTMEEWSCPEIEDMFKDARNLTTIYASESLGSWWENDCVMVESGDPSNEYVRDFRIFDGAIKLKGGAGTEYTTVRPRGSWDVGDDWQYYEPADESYLFRIDGGFRKPGLLTLK